MDTVALKEGLTSVLDICKRFEIIPPTSGPEIKNNKDGNDNDLFEDLDYAQEVYERLSERDLAHIEEDDQKPAVCIFKPRVQILDNWRWCNGTCSGVSGCYSDGSIDKCDPNFDDKGNTFYPWTEYKGAIVVIPSAGTEEETD